MRFRARISRALQLFNSAGQQQLLNLQLLCYAAI